MVELNQSLPFGHKRGEELVVAQQYSPEAHITLFQGDRLVLLEQVQQSGVTAELILTSPPYNIGKEYEQVTSLGAYIEEQQRTIEACLKVLSPTGSICWQVGNFIKGSGKNKE